MKYMKKYENFSLGFSSLESFISWSNKRYMELEYTDEEFQEIISVLENKCKYFLDEIKQSKVGPIFRGVKNSDNTYTRGLNVKSSINNRKPLDTDKNISLIIDNLFQEKYNFRLRSSGIFTSKLPSVASDYGTPYLFFPIGEYKYFWNPDIKDLYGDIEPKPWYYNSSKNSQNKDELEQRWLTNYGPESNGGEYYYNNNGYSNNIIFAVKQAKDDNLELSNKSFEYVKKVLQWEPDIDFESYKENFDEDLYFNLKKIVNNYKEDEISKIKDQEITFICDKYYLVDSAFYQKYLEYLKY